MDRQHVPATAGNVSASAFSPEMSALNLKHEAKMPVMSKRWLR